MSNTIGVRMPKGSKIDEMELRMPHLVMVNSFSIGLNTKIFHDLPKTISTSYKDKSRLVE